jgi:hypothetical protein
LRLRLQTVVEEAAHFQVFVYYAIDS